MRVVLDTNVLVSGLLKPFGPSGKVAQLLSAGDLSPAYDVRILAEYHDVLFRPEFPFPAHQVNELLEQLQANGELVAPGVLGVRLPHADDEMFLEAALAGGAAFLITHNLKHYPRAKRCGVRVVTPTEFLAAYSQDS